MLTVNMLGKVNITYKDVSIDDKLSSKLVALISLLILNRNRDISKEKIAAYLWPDSSEDASRYNLRYNLWMIKKLIPEDAAGQHLIVAGKDYCRLNDKYDLQCDKLLLDKFNAHEQKTLPELIELKKLFKGDFLEGLYLKNCNEFNEMILFERVVCQNKQVEILKELADIYEQQGNYEEGLQILSEIAVIEPYNEAFACRIIEMQMKLGNRAAAINYYKKFEYTLRNNLNISPNNELKLLYANLLESNALTEEHRDKIRTKKKKVRIESRCIKDVEYFWVSDVVNEIIKNTDIKYMLDMDRKYIFDLGFIQNELLIDYEKYISYEHTASFPVPPVRIINAFRQFLSHASDIYDIEIKVIDIENIDIPSLSILKYIEDIKIDGISISY